MNIFLEYLSNSLNKYSLNYVCLRGYEELPYNIATDLDIFISKKDFYKFYHHIKQSSYIIVKENIGYNYRGLFIIVDGDIVQIDFFFELNQKWNRYFSSKSILEDKEFVNNFYIISNKNKKEINAIREEYKHGRKTPLKNYLFFLNYKFYSYIYLYIKKILTVNNIYAFIAPDGAGKSTLINEFNEFLIKNRLYTGSHIIHLRPKFIPRLANIFKLTKENNQDIETLNKNKLQDATGISGYKYILLAIYYFFDFLILYFYKIKTIFKNEVIIFDRYYFDFLVYHNYPIHKYGFIVRFLCKFIPKPKFTVVISGDPNLICSKKNELSAKETHMQLNNIMNLKNDLYNQGNNFIIINQSYSRSLLDLLTDKIINHGFNNIKGKNSSF